MCSGNFRCWLKADISSAVGRIHARAAKPGHYKDLTETENRARKVSGTQGRGSVSSLGIFCSLPCGGGVCRRAVNQKPVACDRPTD